MNLLSVVRGGANSGESADRAYPLEVQFSPVNKSK